MADVVDVRPDQLSTIQAILAAHVPSAEIWAFGSRAKWTARDVSDLDLAVANSASLSSTALDKLRHAFEESYLPFQVDVVDLARVSDEFRKVIEKQKVVLRKATKSNGIDNQPSEWRSLPLEDSVEEIIDYRGKTPRKVSSGIPLITAKVVKNGRIETPDEFIALEDYDGWMRRGMPRAGDVLLTTEAPLGEVAQLDDRKIALAQRLVALRGKSGVLDNDFLKYLLQSKLVQDQLRSRASGTTVLGIKQSELRKVTLIFPSLPEQKAIAAVLGALDDKIELNRRMSATLEAMAQALFQSWFVDPLVNGLPENWRESTVADVLTFNRQTVNPSKFPDEVFAHYSLPAFDEGRIPKSEMGSSIKSHKLLVPRDAILLSKLNPHIPRIWFPNIASSHRAVASTEFLVAQPKAGFSREFIYCLFTSSDFVAHFATLVTGTTGSHQRVKSDSVLQMNLEIAPAETIEKFFELAKPILQRNWQNICESTTLAAIRDALLPKLLSGKIRSGGSVAP